MELQELKENLIEWMEEMYRGYRDPELYMMETTSTDGIKGVRIKLFTEINEYSIVAYPPSKTYKGYMGCIGRSRKPRAGENWTRGNDLADGPCSRDTWIEIMQDIVGYELVKIHRPIRLLYEVDKIK